MGILKSNMKKFDWDHKLRQIEIHVQNWLDH